MAGIEEFLGSATGNAATSLGGSLIDFAGNWLMNRDARKWAEEMWQKQNEYNLPKNQVARLKEAGINPNLAFGSSASAMGTNVPGVPDAPKFNLAGGISHYYERQAILANIKYQKEQARREKLNNDMLEQLMQEKMDWQRLHWKSDSALFNWNIDHLYDYKMSELDKLNLTVEAQRVQNRILEIDEDIKKATKEKNWIQVEMLRREKKHLSAKYDFEDLYYGNKLNPYETNTLIGYGRYLAGGVNAIAENPRKVLPWLINPVLGIVDYWRRNRKKKSEQSK